MEVSMSNLKKIFLGLVVCLTTALPFGIQASETVPVSKAVIQENSTQDISNVFWGRGWGRGYGFGYGSYGYGGYPYSSYGYYNYPYSSYGYGYGCGGCGGCCDSWWGY